jgi:hypothetical protein
VRAGRVCKSTTSTASAAAVLMIRPDWHCCAITVTRASTATSSHQTSSSPSAELMPFRTAPLTSRARGGRRNAASAWRVAVRGGSARPGRLSPTLSTTRVS